MTDRDPQYVMARLRAQFGLYSWEGQALQYPQRGEPGEMVYQRYAEDNPESSVQLGTWIDCLFYYDEEGYLTGVLNHYPYGAFDKHTGQEIDKPNTSSTFVRPGETAEEVRAILTKEAVKRWGPEAAEQSPWPRPDIVLSNSRNLDGNRRQGR